MVRPQLLLKCECVYEWNNKNCVCDRNCCMYKCVYVSCILLYTYVFTVFNLYVCIQLYSAKGINDIVLNKEIKFVYLF